MINDHKRINDLEEEVKKLKKQIKFKDLEVRDDISSLVHIIKNVQPVLGHLIAAVVLLQRKGIILNGELNTVVQEEADKFVAEANPKLVNELQGESEKQRLGGYFPTQQPAVSGDAGIGGDSKSNSL